MINALPFNGCRRTSHHLVETPARYVRASSSSCHNLVSQTMTGHRLRGERRSKGRVLSLPQRLFSHCCQSCCTCLSLAHRQGDPSHHDTFHRSSNQERHPVISTSMRTVTFRHGCSSQTTYHPVPPHSQTTRSLASCLPARLISLPL